MKPHTLSALASLSVFFVSGFALAQDPAASAPPTPPPSDPAATTAAPAAPAIATGQTPTPAEKPAEQAEEATRFRWGISGYGGPLMGGLSGGSGGVDARFGAQITNMLGVYAQPVLLLGAGADASVNGASLSGIALYGSGVLGEVTLADLVYIGVGPELLFGAMGSASASTSTASAKASGSTGPYLSVAARAGFAFGSMRPNRRKAFTIGLDMRTVFNPGDPVIVPCLALGYDAF